MKAENVGSLASPVRLVSTAVKPLRNGSWFSGHQVGVVQSITREMGGNDGVFAPDAYHIPGWTVRRTRRCPDFRGMQMPLLRMQPADRRSLHPRMTELTTHRNGEFCNERLPALSLRSALPSDLASGEDPLEFK
jgi:hypothetical protein